MMWKQNHRYEIKKPSCHVCPWSPPASGILMIALPTKKWQFATPISTEGRILASKAWNNVSIYLTDGADKYSIVFGLKILQKFKASARQKGVPHSQYDNCLPNYLQQHWSKCINKGCQVFSESKIWFLLVQKQYFPWACQSDGHACCSYCWAWKWRNQLCWRPYDIEQGHNWYNFSKSVLSCSWKLIHLWYKIQKKAHCGHSWVPQTIGQNVTAQNIQRNTVMKSFGHGGADFQGSFWMVPNSRKPCRQLLQLLAQLKDCSKWSITSDNTSSNKSPGGNKREINEKIALPIGDQHPTG